MHSFKTAGRTVALFSAYFLLVSFFEPEDGAICCSETSHFARTTRRYNPQNRTVHSHCCGNPILKNIVLFARLVPEIFRCSKKWLAGNVGWWSCHTFQNPPPVSQNTEQTASVRILLDTLEIYTLTFQKSQDVIQTLTNTILSTDIEIWTRYFTPLSMQLQHTFFKNYNHVRPLKCLDSFWRKTISVVDP